MQIPHTENSLLVRDFRNKRLLPFFLGIIISFLSLTYPIPTYSQSIAACAGNPACAAELGLITTAAVGVTAIAVVSPQLSNSFLDKLTQYSQSNISGVQNVAESQQTIEGWGFKNLVDTDIGLAGTIWRGIIVGSKQQCQVEYGRYFGNRPGLVECAGIGYLPWAQLGGATRNALLATDAARNAVAALVISTADAAAADYAAKAKSFSDAALAAYLSGDTALGDSLTEKSRQASLMARVSANISSSSASNSSADTANSDYERAKNKVGVPPTTQPTTQPTTSPLDTPLTPARPVTANFVVYAVSIFSTKFPFDFFYAPVVTDFGSTDCPSFVFFYYQFQFCFLVPLFNALRWIATISISLKMIYTL